jgi:DNA polymerase-1
LPGERSGKGRWLIGGRGGNKAGMTRAAQLKPEGPETLAQKLLLVDGHAYAYRAYFAIRHLTSPAGDPTNAIYGFVKSLARLQTTQAPTHWAVVWDGGLAADRLAAWPNYKAQRPPIPASLNQQIQELQRYLDAARIPSVCEDGVEADDLIATLARHAASRDWRVIIASSDKDFMQLVSDRISLVNPIDKSEKLWTADEVRSKTGVEPAQIVDWLSLVGDSVDNVPGAPGVGPKTASELLRQFGSMSALFERLSEVKSEKVRASLLSFRAALTRNQQLIRLLEDLPAGGSLDTFAVRARDPERLREFYERWGFKGLLRELVPVPSLQLELV